MFQRVWHPNTQIQIHKYTQIYKYTNTVLAKLSDRPNLWYIFEKVMVRGLQKMFPSENQENLEKQENLENQENIENIENQ